MGRAALERLLADPRAQQGYRSQAGQTMAPLVPDFRAWTLPQGPCGVRRVSRKGGTGFGFRKSPPATMQWVSQSGATGWEPKGSWTKKPPLAPGAGRGCINRRGAGGEDQLEAERLDGREALRARPRALAGRGGTLRWGWGRKCNLGEMLLVWEPVDGRVPGDFQGELSRTLRGPRLRAERRGWGRERRDSPWGG